ncbi:MAG: AAA family ATPase [archaeon]|nr:AAA family ATPase [archaeon]
MHMINSIRLQNWRTHLNTELEFEKGTNVIVGKMGAGKSSIMDAISFALYGTFPSLASRKVSLEETIMSKPIKQETATIELVFEYEKKEYTVKRVVKRKGINEAELRLDGKIIAGPKTTEVTKKIEETTKVPYELFSRAIYSEQNQIDFFLKLTPSQRKEKFDELLGLDKYETARSNAVILANRVKKISEDKKKFLAEQKQKNDPAKLEENEKRLAAKLLETQKRGAQKKALEEGASLAEKEVRALEEEEKEARFLRELEIRAKSKKEALEEQFQRLKSKTQGKSAQGIAKELEETRKKLEDLLEQNKEREKEEEESRKHLGEAKEKIAVLLSMERENEKNTKNKQGLEAQCPVCKKLVSEHDKKILLEELAEEKNKIEKSLEEQKMIAAKCEKGLAQTLKKAKEALAKKEELARKSRELETLSESFKEILEKEKQIEELFEETKKLAQQNSEKKFDEKKLQAARKNHAAARETLARTSAELFAAKEMAKELEEGISAMKQTQKQIGELEAQAKEGEVTAEKLAIFTSALMSAQAELRNTMIDTVNGAMEEIWPRIYPYGDFSSVKIIVEDGSYEICAKQRSGEWQRVDGILSGGERSAAAITTRIAVSLVLTQNLGWIILDEPTHNFDANAVAEMSETMRTHLPELIEQIFIITHDKEMENAASGKLYVLEREKENDGPTRISGF